MHRPSNITETEMRIGLVRQARLAEDREMSGIGTSDHFHSWKDEHAQRDVSATACRAPTPTWSAP